MFQVQEGTLPIEILPDLGHELPGHNLHVHLFPGWNGSAFGREQTVIRNGTFKHIFVGVVLQELLRHGNGSVTLSEEK